MRGRQATGAHSTPDPTAQLATDMQYDGAAFLRSRLKDALAMFDHLGIITKDAGTSLPFYEACLAPLGITKVQDQPQWHAAIFRAPDRNEFLWIGAGVPDDPRKQTSGYFHLAFRAPDEAAVRAFYEAALSAGGTDNGKPGLRRPGYFAAFVLDPEGNNIEAAWRSQ